MSLTLCTECQGQVSSLASSCPHCGAPVGFIGQKNSEPLFPKQKEAMLKVETEQTGKIWKSLIIISWVGMFFSLIQFQIDKDIALVSLIFFFLMRIFAKLGAWWNNK